MDASRRKLLLILTVLAVGMAACSDDSGTSPNLGSDPYVEAVAGTWQRLNPIYSGSNAVDQDLTALIFSGLTRLGPDGSVEPDLAESWTVDPEGRTYRFTLREGLRWHDGEPVTSADIAFTIAQIVDPDFRGDPVLAELWFPVTISTPDQRTVVLTLQQAYAPFLARATTVGILPRHLLGTTPASALYTAAFNSAPVGTGPFRLDRIDSTSAVLLAYGGYYGGEPSIPRVEFVFFPDYPAASSTLGGLTEALFLRDAASEQGTLARIEADGVSLDTIQRSAYVVLYLNNDTIPFDEVRVRLAISLALDREAIVDTAMGGYAAASASPIAPGTWAYKPEADIANQNAEVARALLAEAGYTPTPGSGILARDGVEFRFTIRTDSDRTRVAIANAVAHDLEAIGIRVNVASTSFAVLRRDFLQLRRYDAAIAVWEQGPDPDPYFAWHSSQTGPEGLNLANFAHLVSDELISEARVANDDVTRRDFYGQFQDIWQEQVPSVIIAYPESVYATPESLARAEVGVLFDGALRFRGIEAWQQ